tara:strand:+ start:6954 stop:7562 length:609 start_codon:yes stop_codon:yes gene_type:complete
VKSKNTQVTNFDKNNIHSMRYMPSWNNNSGIQISGLIDLCFDIYLLNPKASNWVEIGSYVGESALIFASFSFVKELNCVDPLVFGTRTRRTDLEDCFRKRLKIFMKHPRPKVHLHLETSEEYSKKVLDNSLDVVYIDGSHKYESVLNDLELWYPKLRSGGFLCGHDYKNGHEGVEQAVDEFVSRHQLNINKTYRDHSFMIRV